VPRDLAEKSDRTNQKGQEVQACGLGVATELRQSVEADAKRTAREVARRLAHFFASQGWLPWSAVPD